MYQPSIMNFIYLKIAASQHCMGLFLEPNDLFYRYFVKRTNKCIFSVTNF